MTRQFVRALCGFTCVLLLLAVGCINYDQKMELNSNGSGKMVMHYSMAQQLVSMMQMGGDAAGGETGGDQEMPFKLKEEEVKADLLLPESRWKNLKQKQKAINSIFMFIYLSTMLQA